MVRLEVAAQTVVGRARRSWVGVALWSALTCGLGPCPTLAHAGGLHKHHGQLVLLPVETTARAYVVRSYEVTEEVLVEEDQGDEGDRTIEVTRSTPPPSEVGRSRALGAGQRSRDAAQGTGERLPPLLKTTRDEDGRRVPEVTGTEPATRSRQAEQPRVTVRSTAPTSRVYVRRSVPATTTTRSATVTTRTYRAVEPTVIRTYRAVEPAVVVRESVTATAVPAIIVKRGWCH